MVKTMLGKEVDMESLKHQNKNTIAVGNARMNANGDLLGKGGKILKTKEELALEYHNTNPNAAKNVSLSTDLPEMLEETEVSKNNAPIMEPEVKEETSMIIDDGVTPEPTLEESKEILLENSEEVIDSEKETSEE